MDFERLNNWAFLIANAGVAFGIFLLAYEISQNRRAVEAEIYQERSQAAQELNLTVVESEYLPALLAKTGADIGSFGAEALAQLTAEERVRAAYLANTLRHVMDNNVYQYQQGYLEDDYYVDVVQPNLRRMAPVWEELGLLRDVRRDFRAAIEESLSEVP